MNGASEAVSLALEEELGKGEFAVVHVEAAPERSMVHDLLHDRRNGAESRA